MKIGILCCGHTMPEVEGKHGDFPEMFENLLVGHGFSYVSYDVEHMQFPQDIHTCDGWLLTGSKHGVYEDHPFIAPLEAFIRDAYDAHVPVVGICFGHQLIAQALGGRVEKFDDGWALGLTSYDFEGMGEMRLNAWHQDQVLDPPKGAKTVASNAFCRNAALVYDNRILTIQPHPEFGGPIIADYAALRRGTADYRDDLMDQATRRSVQPDNNKELGQQIGSFFKASIAERDLRATGE